MEEMTKKAVETAKEQGERLQKEVEEYTTRISQIFDIATLDEEEQKCIAEQDANEEYIRGVKFDVPNGVEFEGKRFTRNDVAKYIINFLNKAEVRFELTLGYYELVKLWKTNFDTMSYGELNSTLQCLQNCQFKGMQEWHDILVINEFMKPLHENYIKINQMQIATGHKHNAVLTQRESAGTMVLGEGQTETAEE